MKTVLITGISGQDGRLLAEELAADPKAPIRSTCLRYFNAAGAEPQLRSGEQHEPETHLVPLALLALGLLVRRSGPAWLAGRIPAFEGLAAGSAVTLLLPPRLLETVVRRTTAPGWRTAVLARAAQPEVTR